jgi:hypothetical protein
LLRAAGLPYVLTLCALPRRLESKDVGLRSSEGCTVGLCIDPNVVEPAFKVAKTVRSSRGCNALLSSVIERAEVAWQQREGTLTESSSEIGEDLSDVLYIIS